MIDPADLEGYVEMFYRRAGRDPSTPVRASTLARLLGIRVFSVPHMLSRGESGTFKGEPVIGFKSGLSRAMREHVIAHELAHIERGSPCALRVDDEEVACDYIAAALLMPRRAFLRRLHEVGSSWTQLALDFGVTETSAALRSGETEGRGIAVVTPQVVRARGDIEWPSEETIRAWVRRPGPGISAVRLRDDRRRHVIELDLAEES